MIFCICLYLIKNRMSGNTYGPIFNFYLVLEKLTMSETYGSTNLRLEFFDDKVGKRVKKDTLFHNFYDYWTPYNDPNKKFFWWYSQKLRKLEMKIRRK